jgi:hypothetical protein
MCTIAEANVLLRAQVEMPSGCRVSTEEFACGWNRMRTGGVARLEKKVQTRGWNFLKIANGAMRSGVGATSQEAIASALNQALQRVHAQSNAVEVDRVELTQYPWFFLARVRVFPYRIQLSAVPPVVDAPELEAPAGRQRRSSRKPADFLQEFGSAMPMLKGMLTVSRVSEVRAE